MNQKKLLQAAQSFFLKEQVGEEVSEKIASLFVPQRVFEIVENPEKIETIVVPSFHLGLLEIVVVEKGFHSKASKKLPEDTLFTSFHDLIKSGKLQSEDRVLFTVKMEVSSAHPHAILIRHYDGQKGKGIATEFYTQTLPTVLQDMGFRYILGNNDEDNVDFFLQKIGRFTTSDLNKEGQSEFLGIEDDPFLTIQFLYDEDRERFIKS